jgi:hypothetical protein
MVMADQLGVDRQMATDGTAGILAVSEYAEFTRAQRQRATVLIISKAKQQSFWGPLLPPTPSQLSRCLLL